MSANNYPSIEEIMEANGRKLSVDPNGTVSIEQVQTIPPLVEGLVVFGFVFVLLLIAFVVYYYVKKMQLAFFNRTVVNSVLSELRETGNSFTSQEQSEQDIKKDVKSVDSEEKTLKKQIEDAIEEQKVSNARRIKKQKIVNQILAQQKKNKNK